MSEKMLISEYKGFELWDTPAPEGWRVHQYPVQVTCNGEHVNNFTDAHEAMSVIDGMDADTIAYHMRQSATEQPATAPTGGGGLDRDTVLRNELFGRVQSVLDGCNPAVANEFRNYGSLAEKQIQERDAKLKWLERDYRETVMRLHGIVKFHDLPAPPGEEVDITVEREFATLRAQLAAAEATAAGLRRERDAALDVLRDIARNAPQEQPHANEQWKWTFWFAGSVAKSCVDTLSEQQAADAKPAGGVTD